MLIDLDGDGERGEETGDGDPGDGGGTGDSGAAEQGSTGDGDGGGEGAGNQQSFSADYVKKLRAEAAAQRQRAREIADRLKKLEDEKLSETERQQRRAQELEAENALLLSRVRLSDLTEAALENGANARYASAIARLLPAELNTDDETKVVAAIERLKGTYPDMFRKERADAGNGDAGAGRSSKPPASDMNSILRQAAGRRA